MIAAVLLLVPWLQDGGAPADPLEALFHHSALAQGDFDQAARDWWGMLLAEPNGPYALELLQAIDGLASLGVRVPDAASLLELLPILEGARERDELRGILVDEQLRRMFSSQPLELPEDLYSDFILHWEALGPLGALDHAAPEYMQIDGPTPVNSPDGSWLSASGKPLEWQPLVRDRIEQGIRPDRALWPAAGAAFLRARIRGEAGEHRLEIRASTPLQAWWNGHPLGSTLGSGALGHATRWQARVELDAEQWSTLLIRVPARAASVSARVMRLDGPGFEVESWAQDSGALPVGVATLEPLTQLVESEEKTLPEHSLAPVLAMRRAWLAGRSDRALAIALPAGADEGLHAAFLRERHKALSSASHLPGEVRRRMLLETEAELDELEAFGCLDEFTRIRRLIAEDKLAEALQVAEALEARTVEAALTRMPRLLALFALDKTGAMGMYALRQLVDRFPEQANLWSMLGRRRHADEDWAGALKAAWRALTLDGANSETRALVLAMLSDKPGDARRTALLDVARRWRQWRPMDPAGRDFEAAALRMVGADEALLDSLRDLAVKRPGHPSSWRRLANFHLERGEDAGAHAALSRMLELVPGDPWAREAGEALGIRDPALAFFEDFAPDAREALADARAASDASTAEALDGGLIYLYPDGSRAERTHTLTVALDRKGTEELHERGVVGTPRIAQVLQVGGGVAEPVVVDQKWVMPSLDPGDAVELVYDQRAGGLAGVVPNLGRWSFTSSEKPFLRSYYALFVPDGLGGELRTGHFDGSRDERRMNGGTVHILRAENRGRVPVEVFMPSYTEVLPWAAFGRDIELRHLVEEWRGNLRALSEVPADMEQELQAWIAGREWSADPLERSSQLWSAVVERTLDFGGSPLPVEVWYQKRGNPLFLFALLLERSQVAFDFAFLERPVAPALDPNPVRPFAFAEGLSRPALRIEGADGDALWQLLPASRGAPFGVIPGNLVDTEVVIIGSDDYRRSSLPGEASIETWDLDLNSVWRLEQDGSAQVQGSLSITSAQGDDLLEQLRRASANQREGFVRQFVGRTVSGLDLTSWKIPALESEGDESGLRLEFQGRLPGAIRGSGDQASLSLRIPPSELSAALGPARRIWPLALRQSNRQRCTLRIEPGEHWQIPAAPTGFLAERAGFVQRLDAQVTEGGALELERVVAVRGLVLAPDEVGAFLDQIAAHEREERRPLPLVGR